MPKEKIKKAVFRWSVLFALVHFALLIYFYGMNVPKDLVSFPMDGKDAVPLFEFTRWFDPLAWPIFGAFFLLVFLPINEWTETEGDKYNRPIVNLCFSDILKSGVFSFALSLIAGFILFGLLLSVIKGIAFGLLNGVLAGILISGYCTLLTGAILLVIWAGTRALAVFERLRIDISFVERCLRPFEKLLNFLNAEE